MELHRELLACGAWRSVVEMLPDHGGPGFRTLPRRVDLQIVEAGFMDFDFLPS
jgi:hypothetical protein